MQLGSSSLSKRNDVLQISKLFTCEMTGSRRKENKCALMKFLAPSTSLAGVFPEQLFH